jgi:ferredoxin
VVVGTPYGQVLDCSFCGECVRACPTAALTDQNNFAKIIEELDDLKVLSVAIVDLGMPEKIDKQIKKINPEKDLNKILFALGFEKIINLEEKDQDNEDEIIEKLKTDYARKEKIDPENIRTFFISSKISKKAGKNEYLDYVLSEREVARLVRDKKKIIEGKMKSKN